MTAGVEEFFLPAEDATTEPACAAGAPANCSAELACSYWDVAASTWSTQGCTVGAAGDGRVLCLCDRDHIRGRRLDVLLLQRRHLLRLDDLHLMFLVRRRDLLGRRRDDLRQLLGRHLCGRLRRLVLRPLRPGHLQQ